MIKTSKSILATLVATSLLALMAAPAMAMTNDEKCGPDGPEVYKRAGGYCEQIGQTGSQASEQGDDHYEVLVKKL